MTRTDLVDELLDSPRTCVTDWSDFRERFVPTRPRMIVGGLSFYDMSEQRKYVHHKQWPYGSHELAAVYLKRVLAAAGRHEVVCHPAELRHLDLDAPLYFAGRASGDLTYLDLDRAFFSIYSAIGAYDRPLVWSGSKAMFDRAHVPFVDLDAVADDHLARNSVVGLARTRGHTEVRYGERRHFGGRGRFTSPQLWRTIAAVLGSVAAEMIETFGAVYVHTDGYIVPSDRASAAIAQTKERWGLSLSVRSEGIGEVTGLGSYEVGVLSTARKVRGRPTRRGVDLNNLRRDSLAAAIRARSC